jgi:hypothetical protein
MWIHVIYIFSHLSESVQMSLRTSFSTSLRTSSLFCEAKSSACSACVRSALHRVNETNEYDDCTTIEWRLNDRHGSFGIWEPGLPLPCEKVATPFACCSERISNISICANPVQTLCKARKATFITLYKYKSPIWLRFWNHEETQTHWNLATYSLILVLSCASCLFCQTEESFATPCLARVIALRPSRTLPMPGKELLNLSVATCRNMSPRPQ